MKIARFRAGGTVRLGLVDGTAIASLTDRLTEHPASMRSLIANWSNLQAEVRLLSGVEDFALDQVEFLAPVERPGKVLGIGLNYADHIAEAGMNCPKHQTWFTKAVTSIAGPFDVIERPLVSSALDYEAELVVVIGNANRHLSRAAATAAIFGYCIGNDVSVRDWQMQSGQFTVGKSFDGHAPIGPWIVTTDEIASADLNIRAFVNGELRQQSSTRYLIFDAADQIVHLSKAMTLEPGDLLFTGTPAGVGAAMDPPAFLKAGDCVRIEIDGIGAIENRVVDEQRKAT